MPELAPTACRRCREQKLKCSREQSGCSRCVRLEAVCTYPDPPDRKLIASQRAMAKKRQRSVDISPDENAPRHGHHSVEPAPANLHNITEHAPSDIPHYDLQKLLLDIYFKCMVNSSLTFHRPSFMRMWNEGNLPQPVLLATCAMGSHFVNSKPSWSEQATALSGSIESLRLLAKQWALWSGKQVLQSMDQPTLDAVKVCEVLSLYWFATDDPQRNSVFTGIAYRAARSLSLDTVHSAQSDVDLEILQDESLTWVQEEELRRCFWAAWRQGCLNSDHYIIGTSDDAAIAEIPLPIDNTAFENEQRQNPVTLGLLQQDSSSSSSAVHRSGTTSLTAEIMYMVLTWAKIRDHIEARKRLTAREALSDLFLLDQRLSDWLDKLSTDFTYSKQKLYNYLTVKNEPEYITLHALFHQCRITLHSSLVPQYTGLPPQKGISTEATRTSARIALESAHAISELCTDILLIRFDAARVAPFVGYCIYVSASIHTAFMASKNPRLAVNARKAMLSNLKLLIGMKPYWKNLQRLWARFLLLYQEQIQSFEVSPLFFTETDFSSRDTANETGANAVIRLRRDAGEFAEPSKEALLQYKLGKKRGRNTAASSVTSNHQIVRDARYSHDTAQESLSTQGRETSTVAPQPELGPANSEDVHLDIGSLQELLENNDQEWWDSNIETFLGRALSYDDILQPSSEM